MQQYCCRNMFWARAINASKYLNEMTDHFKNE